MVIQDCRPKEILLEIILTRKEDPSSRTVVCEAIREYIASAPVQEFDKITQFYTDDDMIALEISKMLIRRMIATPILAIPQELQDILYKKCLGENSALKLNSILALYLLGVETPPSAGSFQNILEKRKESLREELKW